MTRTLLAVALTLLALPSFAAIQYEYTLRSSNEDSGAPADDLTARAVVDGARSRVEFLGGTLYPPGTFMISNDGSRLFFVDPTKKWYTEFNASGAVTAIGANNIKIENLRSDVNRLDDTQVIAGIPTEHYQLVIDYDVTVVMRGIPLKQKVHTVIDNWTTSRFGDVRPDALSNSVRTGNAEVDRLLDIETTKVQGFPMKQTITIRTTLESRAARSELKVNPTRTMVREMRVTSLREMAAAPSLFAIPTGYVRADTPDLPRTKTEVLTFEDPK